MKTCPNCKKTYEDEANFCPEEACATDEGPRRLEVAAAAGPRFQPLTQVGGGRTGEVWRAVDSHTGAEVALKTLPVALTSNPITAGRLDREFKQLMRVEHPHVAKVLDAGKSGEGRYFVATELVTGAESLASVLKRGAMPLAQAKQLLAQIGEGLLEAQKAGMVHRDLAPKNILLDPSGQVKIINFAVAVPFDDRLSGVPEYASPEQAQGRPVDQRSNTYSLACVFYHMLTGEPPFAAADPKAVFDLHVSSYPLGPSQRRPDATLSPDVDRVLLKALDKNASKRPLTLRLFLSEVEALTPAAPAAAPGKPDAGAVGFAKTMLFAGGQSEVQEMVQKAIAQRQAAAAAAAGGAPAPASAPVATPVPAAPVVLTHPSTGSAAPRAADGSPMAAARLTPPPVTPNPLEAPQAPVAAAPAASSATAPGSGSAKGAAFRETLWFKKGDVEQMVAEAKAKAAAAGAAEDKVEVPSDDIRPIEDRYVDDGSVTTDDRKKFSLRTGGTATALPTVGRSIPGEKMSEEDIVGELAPGRKMGVFVGVAVAVVVAIVGILMLMGGGKDKAPPPPAAAAPPPAAVPANPAAAAPPAAAVAAPAPVPAQPISGAAADEGGDDAESAKPTKKKVKAGAKRKTPKPPAKSVDKKR